MDDRPLKIKIAVFPADDMDVNMGLAQLTMKGFIERYEVEGRKYIYIPNFVKHQKPHQNETPSLIPPPFKALVPMVEGLAPLDEALGSERGKMKDDFLKDESAVSPRGDKIKLERVSTPYTPLTPEKDLSAWLDAIAPITGAKNARSLAKPDQWRKTVIKALSQGIDLPKFLDAVQEEFDSPQHNERFFVTDNVLMMVQKQSRKSVKKFSHEV